MIVIDREKLIQSFCSSCEGVDFCQAGLYSVCDVVKKILSQPVITEVAKNDRR